MGRSTSGGDLNGDGRPDVIGHRLRDTEIGINNGDGTFTRSTLPDGEYDGVSDLADMNGDGHLDILLIVHYGSILRPGHGDGTFGIPIEFLVAPRIAEAGASTISGAPLTTTADFNGDGRLDLARGTSFYLGHSDGTFDAFAKVETTGSARSTRRTSMATEPTIWRC